MTIAILAQVVGRYLSTWFDFSIAWTEESATFAQIWMILLASGVAMQRKMHVGVDLLMNALPPSGQKILTILTGSACLFFLYIAVKNSFSLIAVGHIQTSSALQMPMWIVYWAMPIGLTYFGLEFFLSLIEKMWPCSEEGGDQCSP
jgi:TRAP-type C4-dicarboxylate transport system permease small subunit